MCLHMVQPTEKVDVVTSHFGRAIDKVDEAKESFDEIKVMHPNGTNAVWVELEAKTSDEKTNALSKWVGHECCDLLFMGRDDKSEILEFREIGVFTKHMLNICKTTDFFICTNSIDTENMVDEKSPEEHKSKLAKESYLIK